MEETAEVLDEMEVVEETVKYWFDKYCDEYNIDDMRTEQQTVFDGAMTYIYRHYLKNSNVLKSSPTRVVPNSINNMVTNHNAYDISKLIELYVYIKELANGYDKVATVAVFKSLTGIAKQTISDWRNKLSTSRTDVNKKQFIEWLESCEEDGLKEFNMRRQLGAQERLNVDHGRYERRVNVSFGATQQMLSGEDIRAMLTARNGQNKPRQLATQDIVVDNDNDTRY